MGLMRIVSKLFITTSLAVPVFGVNVNATSLTHNIDHSIVESDSNVGAITLTSVVANKGMGTLQYLPTVQSIKTFISNQLAPSVKDVLNDINYGSVGNTSTRVTVVRGTTYTGYIDITYTVTAKVNLASFLTKPENGI
jgi:hypothetical protein